MMIFFYFLFFFNATVIILECSLSRITLIFPLHVFSTGVGELWHEANPGGPAEKEATGGGKNELQELTDEDKHFFFFFNLVNIM